MKRFAAVATGLLFCLGGTCALGQVLPSNIPDPDRSAHGGADYLRQVPGTDNVYTDASGDAYEVKAAPLNAGSCDDGGCTVKICKGDGKLLCKFYRCTVSGCAPIAGAS